MRTLEQYLNRWLTCLLLLLAIPLIAQKKGYEPGYIITLEGDTIQGMVRDRSAEPFVEIYARIRFRAPKKSKRKYGPENILGYGAGNRVFESIPLREDAAFFRFRYYVQSGTEQVFLQVIRRQRELTWYHREFVHDDNNYVDYYPLFFREGSPEMVRVTQGMFGLKRQRLLQYFHDCAALMSALETGKLKKVEEVYNFYLESCRLREKNTL